MKSYEQHKRDVQKIRSALLTKNAAVCIASKAPSNTIRDARYKKKAEEIDLSNMKEILDIDEAALTVDVEPKMTVRELTELTLEKGFMPLVVPEFASITVGGALLGAALESTSHRYGQFNDTAVEVDILLGNGTLLTTSKEHHSELFYAIASSYGTLGIVTRVKLRITPAKPYVTLRLERPHHLISYLSQLFEEEFVEGIVFEKDFGVALIGHLSDVPNGVVLNQQGRKDPWYYHQILTLAKKGTRHFTMPLLDYLFRFDKGAFWMGRYLLRPSHLFQALFRYNLPALPSKIKANAPFIPLEKELSPLLRWFCGGFFSSRFLYGLWHKVPLQVKENLFFIQDFYTPHESAEEALNLFSAKTGLYPIWLCPIKGQTSPQFLSPHYGKENFINIGLYGIPKSPIPIPLLTKELEEKIVALGGRKMLYSLTYYDKDFFQKIYHTERLDSLRKTYHAEGKFLPLHKKVVDMV